MEPYAGKANFILILSCWTTLKSLRASFTQYQQQIVMSSACAILVQVKVARAPGNIYSWRPSKVSLLDVLGLLAFLQQSADLLGQYSDQQVGFNVPLNVADLCDRTLFSHCRCVITERFGKHRGKTFPFLGDNVV